MNVNFNTYVPPVTSGGNTQNGNKEYAVTALNLADGEDTIVRFPYAATSEFDLRTTHIVKVGSWYKKINCLGSVSECPLCARGDKLSTRFFVHLLQYTQLPDGTVSTKAKVWDTGYEIAQTLAGYINLYGDLSKLVFKLSRSGLRFETKYNLILLPSEMYPATIYKADFKDFDNFKLTNFFCLTKTSAEIESYINTGSFPTANNQSHANNVNNARPVNSGGMSQYVPRTPVIPPVTPYVQTTSQPAVSQSSVTPNGNVSVSFAPQGMEEVLRSQAPDITPPPTSIDTQPDHSPTTHSEAPRPRRYAY